MAYTRIEKLTGQTGPKMIKIMKLTANRMYGVRNSDNFIFSLSLQSLLERKWSSLSPLQLESEDN